MSFVLLASVLLLSCLMSIDAYVEREIDFYTQDVTTVERALESERGTELTKVNSFTNPTKRYITSIVVSPVTNDKIEIPRLVHAQIHSYHLGVAYYRAFDAPRFTKQMIQMSARSTDERGHLVGSSFGGPAEMYNLIPHSFYSSHFTKPHGRSVIDHWHDMEDEIHTFVREGCGFVNLTLIPIYTDVAREGFRPSSVRMNAIFNRVDSNYQITSSFEVDMLAPNRPAFVLLKIITKSPAKRSVTRLNFEQSMSNRRKRDDRSRLPDERTSKAEIDLQLLRSTAGLRTNEDENSVWAVNPIPVVKELLPKQRQGGPVTNNILYGAIMSSIESKDLPAFKLASVAAYNDSNSTFPQPVSPRMTQEYKPVYQNDTAILQDLRSRSRTNYVDIIDKPKFSTRTLNKFLQTQPPRAFFTLKNGQTSASEIRATALFSSTKNACEIEASQKERIQKIGSKFKDWTKAEFDRRKAERIEDDTLDFFKKGFTKRILDKRVITYSYFWDEKDFTADTGSRLTNVIYAFAEVNADGSVDINGKRLEKLAQLMFVRDELKKVGHNLEVSIAIGGWDNSQYFSKYATSGQFADNLVELVSKHNFDGVDIDWEYPGAKEGLALVPGKEEDMVNYVTLLKNIRSRLDQLASEKRRQSKYLLTMTSAALYHLLADGYKVSDLAWHVDWFNIMTYNFYGAWNSHFGLSTGPNSPLFHSAPLGRPGKWNINWVVKYYYCKMTRNGKGLSDQKARSKIVLGIPSFGRFWNSMLPPDPTKGENNLFRKSAKMGDGGHASYKQIISEWLTQPGTKEIDEKSKTPYFMKGDTLLTYDDLQSIDAKVGYVNDKKLGGVMLTHASYDTDDHELLETLLTNSSVGVDYKFECPLFEDQRWWIWPSPFAGMCGKYAPLYNGFYAICDPDDDGYACCSRWGWCGDGEAFCLGEGSIDYKKSPQVAIQEPLKPTKPVTWHQMNATSFKPGEPRCGEKIPRLENGQVATCNTDDSLTHCCSPFGFCGKGEDFCDCEGCQKGN